MNTICGSVKEVIRTNFKPVYFFYEKILSVQKHFTSKNQLTKQKQAKKKQQRQQFCARTKTSKRGKIVYLRFGAFITLKIFS